MIASIYHIFSHAATKSLLFIAGSGITDCSDGNVNFKKLDGAGYRNKLAGLAFTVGSLSMVGVPMFSGFISKMFFSQAAIGHDVKLLPTLIALAISTILNAVYFMKTVIRIYIPVKDTVGRENYRNIKIWEDPLKSAALILLIILNFILGLNSEPIIRFIESGLNMFS